MPNSSRGYHNKRKSALSYHVKGEGNGGCWHKEEGEVQLIKVFILSARNGLEVLIHDGSVAARNDRADGSIEEVAKSVHAHRTDGVSLTKL